MDKKQKAVLAVDALEQEYPDAKCSLEYDPQKAYELLISTRLSAQCTDARVNIVTKELYKKYTSLQDFANAPLEEMEQMVKTCSKPRRGTSSPCPKCCLTTTMEFCPTPSKS